MHGYFRPFAALLASLAIFTHGCSGSGSKPDAAPATPAAKPAQIPAAAPAPPPAPAPKPPEASTPAPSPAPVATPAPSPAAARPRNVVLIGWDGAQRNHVKECLAKGELPALKKLSADGSMVDIDVTEVTDTKAGWAQILTGCSPALTGVYSNGRFGPIPKGLTIFERLKKQYGAEGIFTAAVVGKKVHVDADAPRRQPVAEGEVEDKDGAGPGAARVQGQAGAKRGKAAGKVVEPGSKIVTENGRQFREWPAKPFCTAREAGHESGLDVWINGLNTNDRVGEKAIELLTANRDKPFFFFVHFAEVDHQGHKFGENSKEYTEALVSSDKWTGRIVEKLRELKLLDNTLVCVTADHGFDEGQQSHRAAPYVFLAASDKSLQRAGTRADITPTILDLLGLDLARLQPPLDGRPVTKALPPGEKLPEIGPRPGRKGPKAPDAVKGAGKGKAARKQPAEVQPAPNR